MNFDHYDFDVIGVGFGPANIALAIAMEEMNLPHKVRFFESGAASEWQSGMLFEDSDIQNHPLRDLVTPSNPRSRYTFTNFLFENNRLFEHLNLGMYFPYRIEYAEYIKWVSAYFDHLVSYDTRITGITMVENGMGCGSGYKLRDNHGNEYLTKSLVLAPGRSPYIPKPFDHMNSPQIRHMTAYQDAIAGILPEKKDVRVCVVGSSQSAVEAILHLSEHFPRVEIVGVLRSFGYRLKDTSPFTGEVYFPQFVDLFFDAKPDEKKRLIRDLYRTNYGSADGDVLDKLYRRMYVQKLKNAETITIHRSADVVAVQKKEGKIRLCIRKVEESGLINEDFDLVILATGFKDIGTGENQEAYPPIVEGLLPYLSFDEHSCIRIGYDYRVEMNERVSPDACCFLNGLCESSHGMGDAGSFSLLSLRARAIAGGLINENIFLQKTL